MKSSIPTIYIPKKVNKTKLKLKLNINDSVKLKLTDAGREVMKSKYEKYNSTCPKRYLKKGFIEMQIHDIMNIFGEHTYMGMPKQLIEKNELIIEIDKL